MNIPSCATKQQHEGWLHLAKLTGNPHFCTDCTPGYQARMKIVGRCDYPGLRFDDEGATIPRVLHLYGKKEVIA